MTAATAPSPLPPVHGLATQATDAGHAMIGRLEVCRCVDRALAEAFADVPDACRAALAVRRDGVRLKARQASLAYLDALDALRAEDVDEWLRVGRLFEAEFAAKGVNVWEDADDPSTPVAETSR